jgi:hypothetical protein
VILQGFPLPESWAQAMQAQQAAMKIQALLVSEPDDLSGIKAAPSCRC